MLTHSALPIIFLEKPPLQTSTNSHAIISSVDRRHELVRSTYPKRDSKVGKLVSICGRHHLTTILRSWRLSGIFFWGRKKHKSSGQLPSLIVPWTSGPWPISSWHSLARHSPPCRGWALPVRRRPKTRHLQGRVGPPRGWRMTGVMDGNHK